MIPHRQDAEALLIYARDWVDDANDRYDMGMRAMAQESLRTAASMYIKTSTRILRSGFRTILSGNLQTNLLMNIGHSLSFNGKSIISENWDRIYANYLRALMEAGDIFEGRNGVDSRGLSVVLFESIYAPAFLSPGLRKTSLEEYLSGISVRHRVRYECECPRSRQTLLGIFSPMRMESSELPRTVDSGVSGLNPPPVSRCPTRHCRPKKRSINSAM